MKKKLFPLAVWLMVSGIFVASASDHSHGAVLDGAREEISADGLLTAARSSLSVCVHRTDDAPVLSTDVAILDGALEEVSRDVNFAAHYPPQLVVVEGCPAPTLPFDRPVSDYRPNELAIRPAVPSQHRVHVYLVPPGRFQETFGKVPFFRTTAELECFQHVCWGVTTGLYVASDSGEPLITSALLHVLGLVEPPPDPVADPAVVEERRREELEGR